MRLPAGRVRKAFTRSSISAHSRLTWLLDMPPAPIAFTRSSTERVEIAVDVGLLDHRHQGLLGRAPGFEEAREVAALAQLRDLQRDPTRPGIPVPVPVSVALNLAQRRARALRRPGAQLHLQLP